MKRLGQSVLAVLTGYVASLCMFLITGYVLYDLIPSETFEWHHPPYYSWTSLAGELVRLVISVAIGGYVAASIAGQARRWHAAVMAALILVPMACQGFPNSYDRPAWYWVFSLGAII